MQRSYWGGEGDWELPRKEAVGSLERAPLPSKLLSLGREPMDNIWRDRDLLVI